MLVLRFFSLLLGAGAVVCAYGLARAVRASVTVALAAAAFAATMPQFLFIASSVSNDALITALTGAALWVLVVALRDGRRVGTWLIFGLLAGLASLTKVSGLLLPVLGATMAIIVGIRRRDARIAVLGVTVSLGGLLICTGWWYLRNTLLYGDPLGLHIHFFHGFEYDTSGRCTVIPANGRSTPVPKAFHVQAYPTYEAHGFIFIWWGQPVGEVPLPRFFDDIDESFSYGSARDPWRAHYSRVIENQLDVPHVPFIHYNSIGRGGRTVIDGPWVEWKDSDRFFIHTLSRPEDGTPARRADEMPRPDKTFHLDFIFPNLWQNYISADVRAVIAFAPVDDENTLMYLRFYQKFMRTPVLRNVVNRLSIPFNAYVAHQDRRVVQTQLPKRSDLRMGEKLIPGDGPIIAYRRRRQELIEAASGKTAKIA